MNSYQGNTQYSDRWDEYLYNCIVVYETRSKMCEIKEVQKL